MSDKPCGCCEGDELLVPASLENRPGLSALSYRVGTHGSFKQTMLALLSRDAALDDLTTRDDDDPSIALIDAWSSVLDVLTFYQERIVNEGYLRTAVESLSLKELARAISYKPRPGVAAETYFAFDVENPAPGSPGVATIPEGTKVQSIPFPGETPQTFETTEALEANAAWNRLKLKTLGAQKLKESTTELYLDGVTTQLQKGDALLIVSSSRVTDVNNKRWVLRFVTDLKADTDNNWTWVQLDQALSRVKSADAPLIFALRQRAALFGNNPPDFLSLSKDAQAGYRLKYGMGAAATTWPSRTTDGAHIDLDTVYPRITPGSWVVLTMTNKRKLYGVKSITNPSLTLFALSGKVTRITPDKVTALEKFKIKKTTAFAQSELLELAEVPITAPLSGKTLDLDEEVEGLTKGQMILVAGTTTNGDETGETALIESVSGATITLQTSLTNDYDLQTVTVYGNVAHATHGETKQEILGSGSGAQSFQKFTLKNKPLTYVPSEDAPSGGESTLDVRVNAVLWEEVPTLYGQGPRDGVYITLIADDGTVSVQFGDGRTGARLPTGSENVSAAYRAGIGLPGLLQAEQLSLLLTRPLGVRGVTNPLATINAADPETSATVRQNAPLTVLTFDRVVSLKDFEQFAAAYSGIGKAQALSMRSDESNIVYITIAGVNNAVIDASNPLRSRLRGAIETAGAKAQSFQLLTHTPLTFGLKARVLLEEDYLEDDVVARLTSALSSAFSFEQRSLGQSVARSDLIAVMQAVEGVQAIALDSMFIVETGIEYEDRLPAYSIRRTQAAGVLPAEMLTIDMTQVDLTMVLGLTS